MSGNNKEKEVYIVQCLATERIIKLSNEQYKAIQWLLDEFDGCDTNDICLWEFNENETEEIE